MSTECEIERKFLPRVLPDLTGLVPLRDERWYLARVPGAVIRFQKRGDRFELERMVDAGELSRTQDKWLISEAEYVALKAYATVSIVRDSYMLQEQDPQITLKIYHGAHEGLARIEVEFPSLEAARAFTAPPSYGPEITDSPLGSDGRLIELTREQVQALLAAAR